MKTYHFEEELPEGKQAFDLVVEIGTAQIEGHNGRSLIIDAELEQMEISLSQEGNTTFVHVHKNESWSELGQKLTNRIKGIQPKARLTIKLPAQCELRAKTIAGSLAVNGIDAPVTTRVITGKTTLQNLNGPIYAKTITGKLQYEGNLIGDHHRFEAITGSVQIKLQQIPNAHFDARTTTGKIRCD
ncbi:MAG: hypothetical protein KC419_12870, partial [Anaerolineales bacterium]|nr:hypothetical protein [Anaerolineales bacterium]